MLSRNTLFPNSVRRYELTPEKIDCITFCSKNYAPILPRIGEITDRFATYFHYTITAYGRDVEQGVQETFLMRNSKERTLFDERNTERIEL